jgi:hypothetical protein
MSFTGRVDVYCERTDPGFWSEPLNAVSNLAFLIAALLLWRFLARAGGSEGPAGGAVQALPWLLGLVGVCSFLFHTRATVWAGLADQLAILLYGGVFLYAFLRQAVRAPAAASLAGAAAFCVASYATTRVLPASFLNGSGAYFPYLAGLAAMGMFLRAVRVAAWRGFALGTGLFCTSLALRTIDEAVCGAFPLGTHFAWHLLNAMVLLILAQALIRAIAQRARS